MVISSKGFRAYKEPHSVQSEDMEAVWMGGGSVFFFDESITFINSVIVGNINLNIFIKNVVFSCIVC
jgi:hypothetical protein